jgi:hypothetical protein
MENEGRTGFRPRIFRMKYRQEKHHPALKTSLRSCETIRKLAGDPRAEWRDMSEEQRAAFRKPGESDARVIEDESNQGRTR